MSMNEIFQMEQSNDLPQAIITDDILVRLPLKSLCRFKAVSKLWYAMISSHKFAKSVLNSTSKSCVFYQINQSSWLLDYEAYDHQDAAQKCFDMRAGEYVDPTGLHPLGEDLYNANLSGVKYDFPIFGSSFGLVCLLVQKNLIGLCNPILRQWRMISAPNEFVKQERRIGGFGYVSSIDDFKIVLGAIDVFNMDLFFTGPYDPKNSTMYVFSLRNNSWKMIPGGDELDVLAGSQARRHGTMVNERLHWWTIPLGNKDDCRIFAFDLAHEVFDEIPIPEPLSCKALDMYNSASSSGISAMGEALCLSIFREDNMEIWIMKQYGARDSWAKMYDLSVPRTYLYKHNEFFGFTKTGKFLIRCRERQLVDSNSVLLVDPRESPPKFNPLWCLGGDISNVMNYVESLISPFGLAI